MPDTIILLISLVVVGVAVAVIAHYRKARRVSDERLDFLISYLIQEPALAKRQSKAFAAADHHKLPLKVTTAPLLYEYHEVAMSLYTPRMQAEYAAERTLLDNKYDLRAALFHKAFRAQEAGEELSGLCREILAQERDQDSYSEHTPPTGLIEGGHDGNTL